MARPAKYSAEDWLDAGLDALVEGGPSALTAEGIARRIGTTKGSFYWFFGDLDGFLNRLPERFLHRQGIADGSADHVAGIQLRSFWKDAAFAQTADGVEAAMRAWGQRNTAAATAIAALDAHRFAILAALLAERDLTNPRFTQMLLSAWVGASQTDWPEAEKDDMLLTLIDLILALE